MGLFRFSRTETLFILFALFTLSISTHAGDTTDPGASDTSSGNGNYKRLGTVRSVTLDAFAGNGGSIAGVELECSRNKDGKIGFCSNANCNDGGKGGAARGGGIRISREFAEYIDNYAYKCFQKMVDSFGECDGGVAFCGGSGHSKRNAQKKGDTGVPSRHSTGDAMDISGSLYCGNNKLVTFTEGGFAKDSKEYNAFTVCLQEQAKEAAKAEPNKYSPNCGGCIGTPGSQLQKQNDGHDDHIHFSAPVKRPGRISST